MLRWLEAAGARFRRAHRDRIHGGCTRLLALTTPASTASPTYKTVGVNDLGAPDKNFSIVAAKLGPIRPRHD